MASLELWKGVSPQRHGASTEGHGVCLCESLWNLCVSVVKELGKTQLIQIVYLQPNRAGAGASDAVEDAHDFAVGN